MQFAGQHQGPAHQKQQKLAQPHRELHDGPHGAPDFLIAHIDHLFAGSQNLVSSNLGFFAAKRLYDSNAVENVVNK